MKKVARAVWTAILTVGEFFLTPIIERNPRRMAGYSLADVILSSTAIVLLAANAAAIYRVAFYKGALGWPDAWAFLGALLLLVLKRHLDLINTDDAVDLLKTFIQRSGHGDVGVPLEEQERGSREQVDGQEG